MGAWVGERERGGCYYTQLDAHLRPTGTHVGSIAAQGIGEGRDFLNAPRQAAAAIMTTSALRDGGPAHPPAGSPSVISKSLESSNRPACSKNKENKYTRKHTFSLSLSLGLAAAAGYVKTLGFPAVESTALSIW